MHKIELSRDIILSANGVIRASVIEELQSFKAIRQTIIHDAHSLAEHTKIHMDEITQTAKEKGYRDGLNKFLDAVEQLNTAKNMLFDQMEHMLTRCLLSLLKEIPRDIVLKETIATVLDKTRESIDISIAVHPAHIAILENAIIQYINCHGRELFIKAEVNDQLDYDACHIYAGPEIIDVSIPAMTAMVINALKPIPEQGEGNVC